MVPIHTMELPSITSHAELCAGQERGHVYHTFAHAERSRFECMRDRLLPLTPIMSVRKPTLTQGTGNNARVTGHSEAARSWRVPPNTLFSTDGTPRGEALRRLSPSGCVGCCAMRSRPDSQSCHGSHCCHNGAHCAPSRSASHHLCTPSSDTSASSCDDSSCAACWSGAHRR